MRRFLRGYGRGSRLEYNLVNATVLVFLVFGATTIGDRHGELAGVGALCVGLYLGLCTMARRMHDLGFSFSGFLHHGSEYPSFYLRGKSLSTTPGKPGRNEWGWPAGVRRPEKTGIPARLVNDD